MNVGDLDRFVFIVGAPRCGTTTLSQFLKEHPGVSFPVVKEPHFFAQNDLRGLSDEELRLRVESDYLGRFFRSDPGRRVGADASVTYLYTPEQLEPVLRLWPDSRFIVALRNPLTMLPSLHRRLIYVGVEPIDNFEEAWAASRERLNGARSGRRGIDPRWLRYDEAARFATYLERLFAVVGRERCLVMILDDFVTNPSQQYRRFMEFVGLEPIPRNEFTVYRTGYGVRVRWLQRLLKQPAIRARQLWGGGNIGRPRNLAEREDGVAKEMIFALRRRLLRWNRVPLSPEPLSAAMLDEISGHFEGEVARLKGLIGRDLTHWLRLRT
jgi:hypothetical protein